MIKELMMLIVLLVEIGKRAESIQVRRTKLMSKLRCPNCQSNQWGFSSIFGVFDCHKCEHEWHAEELEDKVNE